MIHDGHHAQLDAAVLCGGFPYVGQPAYPAQMDFPAVGMPVNLASRLMRKADPQFPCVSQETYDVVRDHFEFAPGNPRVLELEGVGQRQALDVVGRKKEGARS